jgi:hypothetical protein
MEHVGLDQRDSNQILPEGTKIYQALLTLTISGRRTHKLDAAM